METRPVTSRITRGFHRIGIVLAIPVLLLAAGLAGREEWLQRATQVPGQYHASFGTPLRLLGLAVILYAAARVIGRVFDVLASSHSRS